MIVIAPSILAADFARLGEDIEKARLSGAQMLHIDIMDGHFVRNFTIGPPVVSALRRVSPLAFNLHMMIDNPSDMLDSFIDAGADIIAFHFEAPGDPQELIRRIKKAGKKAAIAIKPDTPAQALLPYLSELAMALVMTVEPGYGAQEMKLECLEKVRFLRQECRRRGICPLIGVDGGVNLQNIGLAAESGANLFAVGSAVYGAADMKRAISALREAAEAGFSKNNA